MRPIRPLANVPASTSNLDWLPRSSVAIRSPAGYRNHFLLSGFRGFFSPASVPTRSPSGFFDLPPGVDVRDGTGGAGGGRGRDTSSMMLWRPTRLSVLDRYADAAAPPPNDARPSEGGGGKDDGDSEGCEVSEGDCPSAEPSCSDLVRLYLRKK
ncbi:hypothetical protein OCS_02178 [Ophiocordyceps sinensis CO18]|uniref:Uncharacterized protein n=1 Tax=Ophiocordyceps sinensis (strain Co18 / CGMCC 3.14243) TaxID=911162 RepID=T5AHQ4_OPHSC|nr:hypothetical protein OCS_02178 [Ophiocordyceps sinensis CO18]